MGRAWSDFAAEELAVTPEGVQVDPIDMIMHGVANRRGYQPSDPDGGHFYMGCQGWDRRKEQFTDKDCPYCGSRVVRDEDGRVVGYIPGRIQARAEVAGQYAEVAPGAYAWESGPAGRVLATEDTCAHCHRSGSDDRLAAETIRDAGRVAHLEEIKARERASAKVR